MTSQTILDGRKIIEEYKIEHEKLYIGLIQGVSEAPDHKPLIDKMRKQFKVLGFEDEGKFIEVSRKADEEEFLLNGGKDIKKVIYWI